MAKQTVHICWLRRDLRLHDNAALYHALKEGIPVIPVFVFDRSILDKLIDKQDRRVEFIHLAITAMQQQLQQLGSSLEVFYGFPAEVFQQLAEKYTIKKVFANHDYEPYAKERDEAIQQQLKAAGILFHTCKDQVIFEKDEVVKDDGKPYTVFTPYSRKWKAKLNEDFLKAYPLEQFTSNFHQQPAQPIPSLAEMGFTPTGLPFPPSSTQKEIIKQYKDQRDFPAIEGTSRLSVHLRFGTISILELAKQALG
jgi:deoxyribodipyrimidine photo-lyase